MRGYQSRKFIFPSGEHRRGYSDVQTPKAEKASREKAFFLHENLKTDSIAYKADH